MTRLHFENWIQTQKIEYSDVKCDFDECPFLALKNKTFCTTHQREFEIIMNGGQPDHVE